jgi:hypothetical protein
MKPIKFFTRIAVAAVLASASTACSSSNNVASSPTPSQEKPPQCVLAAGRIWANVQLYRDNACQQPFAKISSASGDTVTLQFDSGEVETKTRDAVKEQAYVMTNDPAIP